MKLSINEITHRCCAPSHSIGQTKLIEKCKGRCIRLAHEMIKALYRKAIEIKMSGHASRLRTGLKQLNQMTGFGCMISCREAHNTRADNRYTTHAILHTRNWKLLLLQNISCIAQVNGDPFI